MVWHYSKVMGYTTKDVPMPQPEDFGITLADCKAMEERLKQEDRRAARNKSIANTACTIVGGFLIYAHFVGWFPPIRVSGELFFVVLVFFLVRAIIIKEMGINMQVRQRTPGYMEYRRYKDACKRYWELRQLFPPDDCPLYARRNEND